MEIPDNASPRLPVSDALFDEAPNAVQGSTADPAFPIDEPAVEDAAAVDPAFTAEEAIAAMRPWQSMRPSHLLPGKPW